MTDPRWRPPVDEALDMADAFREGVPLGWQRAFVALADAYRDVLAERDALRGAAGVTSDEVEMMGRYLRFPLPDGSTQLVSRPRYITGELVPMTVRPYDPTVGGPPLVFRGGVDVSDEYRGAPTHASHYTVAEQAERDARGVAQENRWARRALMIACALALVVAGFVHFLG